MLETRVSYRAHPAQALFLVIIAALACTVSVVLTVRFCWDLRGEDGVFAGLVAVGIGLAWEISKYVYAPVGVRLVASGRPAFTLGGVGLCAISAVLVIGSVGASLGFLSELDDQHQQAQLRSSAEYQDARAQLAALDSEISILTETAGADSQHSYRKRALATLATVRELRTERAELRRRLATMQSPTAEVAQAGVFGGLADFLSADPSRVRVVAYAVVSAMLELISLAAVMLLRTSKKLQTAVPDHGEVVTTDVDAAAEPPLASVIMFTPCKEATQSGAPNVAGDGYIERAATSSEPNVAGDGYIAATSGAPNVAGNGYIERAATSGKPNVADGGYIAATLGEPNVADGGYIERVATSGEPNVAGGGYIERAATSGEPNVADGGYIGQVATLGEPNVAGNGYIERTATSSEPNVAGDGYIAATSGERNVADGGYIAATSGELNVAGNGYIGRAAESCDSVAATSDEPACSRDPKYAQAVQLIRDGRLRPSSRAVQHAIGVGQRKAGRFLKTMVVQGFVQRVGRRYQFAGVGA